MAVGLRGNYSAFNEAVGSLYGDSMLLLEGRKQPFEFDDGTFSDAARMVYEAGGFDLSQLTDPKARAVINETLRVLSTAIDSGLTHEVPETLRHALENNAFIFSGFKTFHALREVGLSMVTDKGDIKPYNDFLKDVLKINNRYNHNYLYAEYNHALGASQMAAKWHDFEQDGDRYDLQYRTAGDGRVREEHAMLHGITLPPSDPFWDRYLAPNGWNCRCDAVQVRKGKYERTDPKLAMTRGDNCTDALKQRMFRYNPGKTMELFPPKHPYYKGPKPEPVKQAIDGYTPVEWTPKTVAQAEQFYRDKLGVNCSLAGFTAKEMDQIEAIFRSVERHFQCFPELKKETLFVGSITGRIKLLSERKLAELKADPRYSSFDDAYLKKYVSSWITRMKVRVGKNTYAYSHGAFKDWGLSGICFNTSWKGEKINNSLSNDVKAKWHPPGCGTLKAVFDHELGHEIDRLLGLNSNAEFQKLYTQEHCQGKAHIIEILSEYGNKNAKEFIAEAWSEYLNNEKPRPVAVAVGTIIKKLYAEKNQSPGSSSPAT